MKQSKALQKLKRRVRYANANGADIQLSARPSRSEISRANMQVYHAKRARSALRTRIKTQDIINVYNELQTKKSRILEIESLRRPIKEVKEIRKLVKKLLVTPIKKHNEILQKANDTFKLKKFRNPKQRKLFEARDLSSGLNESLRKKRGRPSFFEENYFNLWWQLAVQRRNYDLLDKLARYGLDYTILSDAAGFGPQDIYFESAEDHDNGNWEYSLNREEILKEYGREMLDISYEEKRKFKAPRKKVKASRESYDEGDIPFATMRELKKIQNDKIRAAYEQIKQHGKRGRRF